MYSVCTHDHAASNAHATGSLGWIQPCSGIDSTSTLLRARIACSLAVVSTLPVSTITINGRDQEVYFARPVLRMMIAQPLQVTDRLGQFDVIVTVEGSGLSGQAGAIRHGLSKALTYYEPALRPVLKPHGFLTRDSRVVERKKYGRAKARKSFQFSKR